MSDPPIACTLSHEARRCRLGELLPALATRACIVEPMTNGVRLVFDTTPGLLADVASVIERERVCCRFLRFVVDLAPDQGSVVLELSGPDGTRAFLATISPEFSFGDH